MKFQLSGFSGITNGLVELFLDHFGLTDALPKQLMKSGEEWGDFPNVRAIKTQLMQSGGVVYVHLTLYF